MLLHFSTCTDRVSDTPSYVHQLTKYVSLICRCLVWFGEQRDMHQGVSCPANRPLTRPIAKVFCL